MSVALVGYAWVSKKLANNHLIEKLTLTLPSSLQRVEWPTKIEYLNNNNIKIYVKRDDLIHPIVSGNKWRKLSSLFLSKKLQSISHIVSFGGAYSNHLHALGYICHKLNIKCTAIVRGDYSRNLTPMLSDLTRWNTDIKYVSKNDYNRRSEDDYLTQIKSETKACLIIPEGGSSDTCITGVQILGQEINQQLAGTSHVLLPVASGGTMAGLINYYAQLKSQKTPELLGVGVLKGTSYLRDTVTNLLDPSKHHEPFRILDNYHHGGYAKNHPKLEHFMQKFIRATEIPLEKVYSGKCFYALDDLLNKEYFAPNSKIVIIHTGGIQGNR